MRAILRLGEKFGTCGFRSRRLTCPFAAALILLSSVAMAGRQEDPAVQQLPTVDSELPSAPAPDSSRGSEPPSAEELILPAEQNQPPDAAAAPSPANRTNKRAKPAEPKPYKNPFYDNDFSYLDDPGYVSEDHFDVLKRIRLFGCSRLDLGGERQARFHNEQNLFLDGRDNDFLLQHTRLYADLYASESLRIYAEYIDAVSNFERQPPRGSEENRSDMINLFSDIRLYEDCRDGALWLRGGRQELDYGNQRLIAAAPWANTRVTYDGAKAFWKSGTWDVDALWVRPVPLSQHVDNDHNFDHPDQSQQLMGVYAVWHETPNHTLDLYYLRLEEEDPLVRGGDGTLGGFDANTFGSRYAGNQGSWLWELEGALQFGDFANDDQFAGFYTVGAGYSWDCLPWKPVLWAYFDWASGDPDPNDDERNTFNQLFPQTHAFLGLADVLGRQNIEDLNFKLSAKPHDRVTLIGEWHIFRLEEARDALYNNAGGVARIDPSGASGDEVGQELDFICQLHIDQHSDLSFGYAYFFAGEFLANTGVGDDARFFYSWLTYKF